MVHNWTLIYSALKELKYRVKEQRALAEMEYDETDSCDRCLEEIRDEMDLTWSESCKRGSDE